MWSGRRIESHPFCVHSTIWCVRVISSSKAGWHYHTSANLTAMKWSRTKSYRQLLVLLVLRAAYTNTTLEDFTAFKSKWARENQTSFLVHANNITNVKCTESLLLSLAYLSVSSSLLLSCNQAVITPLLWFFIYFFISINSPAES